MTHYTVEPYDIEGGAEFSVEGLQATLDAVYESYGGKRHKPEGVRPALSAGGGVALLLVEEGHVILRSDRGATQLAKVRQEQDELLDGRTREYAARVYVARERDEGALETVLDGASVVGEGLMDLFRAVAAIVETAAGCVPPGLYKAAIEKRERAIRTQLSRAGSMGREGTTVNIPKGGDYIVNVYILTDKPTAVYSAGEVLNWIAPKK